MKTEDIKQKIEQFTNGLDADYIVIVNPKDGDRAYACVNGNVTILVPMIFDMLKKISNRSNMPFVTLCRLIADVVEEGENYGC